ncbi:hypothetical protein [Pseudomonas sp. v388]|uniref:hypothetical protein n=1 Tax=Pseudomonas sp. v388 TaxID=2479849 RepID=UPI000F78AA4B|nr:hypothetical protein [Pseudomonas sp. v388]
MTNDPAQGTRPTGSSGTSQEHLQNLGDEAGAALKDVQEQGAEQYEHYRDLAAEQLDSLVEGAQSAASALEGKDSLGISQYLSQLASGLGSFADQVRDKSAEDLLHSGARLARENPALFLAGSVAIGVGLSRFLRASAQHDGQTSAPEPAYGAQEQYQTSVAPLSEDLPSAASVQRPAGVVDPLGESAIHPAGDNAYPHGNSAPHGSFKGGV